jgi:hypothetical protein
MNKARQAAIDTRNVNRASAGRVDDFCAFDIRPVSIQDISHENRDT